MRHLRICWPGYKSVRLIGQKHQSLTKHSTKQTINMQFLICLALCVAVAQAGFLASPVATYAAAPVTTYAAAAPVTTYAASAPLATYTRAVAPVTTYAAAAPLTTYTRAVAPVTTYSAAVPAAYTASVYGAPTYTAPVATYAAPISTYAAPAIFSPYLKKK